MFDPNALIIFLSIIGFFFLWLLPLLYMAIVDGILQNKGNYAKNRGIRFLYRWAKLSVNLARSVISIDGSGLSNAKSPADGCILILFLPFYPIPSLLFLPLLLILLPIVLVGAIVKVIIGLFRS